MKYLMILILACVFTCADAQRPAVTGTGKHITAPPAQKVLIADETWIVASGKSSFRIITSNDTIAKLVMRKFEDNGMTKFVYTRKKDSRTDQIYYQRDFYFKNESWNDVITYMKTLK